MALIKCKECGNENAKDAKTCPKCGTNLKRSGGWGTKALFGVGGLLVIGIVGARSGKGEQQTTPVQPAQAAVALTSTPVGSPAAAAPVAVSERHATLEFGKPTIKTEMGITQVMVEAKNTNSSDVKACMVTATFKKGDTILGTANGAVNEVPAGGTRTAQLMSTDSIAGYDVVKLEASTCF